MHTGSPPLRHPPRPAATHPAPPRPDLTPTPFPGRGALNTLRGLAHRGLAHRVPAPPSGGRPSRRQTPRRDYDGACSPWISPRGTCLPTTELGIIDSVIPNPLQPSLCQYAASQPGSSRQAGQPHGLLRLPEGRGAARGVARLVGLVTLRGAGTCYSVSAFAREEIKKTEKSTARENNENMRCQSVGDQVIPPPPTT